VTNPEEIIEEYKICYSSGWRAKKTKRGLTKLLFCYILM
jgi:hypothetical protein